MKPRTYSTYEVWNIRLKFDRSKESYQIESSEEPLKQLLLLYYAGLGMGKKYQTVRFQMSPPSNYMKSYQGVFLKVSSLLGIPLIMP